MYIKTKCTQCGRYNYQNINVHIDKTHRKPSIKKIEVMDNVTEEEFALQILHGLEPYVYNGIDILELYIVLKKGYGIAATHCCDLLTRLKIEMGMYCPDRRHLYFVDPFPINPESEQSE